MPSRVGGRREQRQKLLVQREIDFNNALMLEQQEQYKSIERDVVQIGDIFKDLSLLVNEQGIQIGKSCPLHACCDDAFLLISSGSGRNR